MKHPLSALAAALALLGMLDPTPALAQAPPKPAGCRMALIADLPVTFKNHRPTVPVEINGHPMTALVDSGAHATVIFADAAQRIGLEARLNPDVRSFGVDGEAAAAFAHVSLGLMGVKGPPHDMLVSGKSFTGVDMLLGEDILSQAVLEMDLANNKIRLLRPKGCKEEDMAYWAQTYSEAEITDGPGHHIYLTVMLNGVRVPAILDSGAGGSVATEHVAFQAGVTLPPATGRINSHGIAGTGFEARRGQVQSVQVGDEKIGATTLRFGPLYEHARAPPTESRAASSNGFETREMLLGADFLKAHHVLIDRERGRMYFTYNGGPVFLPDAPPSPDTGTRR